MNDVSDRLFLGRIVPGMDVCDVTGEKVGSIAHIYRFDEATTTDETTPARRAHRGQVRLPGPGQAFLHPDELRTGSAHGLHLPRQVA